PNSAIEKICMKMMAKSPEDRFPSMAAVADALNGIGANAGAPAACTGKQLAIGRLWSWTRNRLRGSSAAKQPPDEHRPEAPSSSSPSAAPVKSQNARSASSRPAPPPATAESKVPSPDTGGQSSHTAVSDQSKTVAQTLDSSVEIVLPGSD